MPHRRPRTKGSFGAHFDELVTQFPARQQQRESSRDERGRSAELQEKLDIHALLFERAWQLERGGRRKH